MVNYLGDAFPDYSRNIQSMLGQMAGPSPVLKQIQEQLNAPGRRIQEMAREMQRQSMAPLLKHHNQLSKSVADMVLGPQRRLAESLRPSFNFNLNSSFEQSFRPVLEAARISVPVPDVSYLANLGSLAESGGFTAEFVEAARANVEAQEGLPEAIDDFSNLVPWSDVFDARTIEVGTYVFVFIVWFSLMLTMTGHPGPAAEFAELLGFTGLSGTHPIANAAAQKASELAGKLESGGYSVDDEVHDDEESGPDPA